MGKKNNRRIVFFMVFVVMVSFVFLMILFDGEVSAQMRPEKTCVTEKCHQDMGKEKFVHGPAATGDCIFCHEPTAKHDFKPIGDVGALCYKCHDKLDVGRTVHAPVNEGRCSGCHDPHQSENRFQLRGAGADLCFICHEKGTIMRGDFIHGPVAVGGCSVCHNPHSSDFPKMLMAEGNEVCYSCHTDKAETFQEKKFSHAPVRESCLMCHDPHSGNFMYNFAAEGEQELCFTCHYDKKTDLADVKVKHGGLNTERKCLACHDPHVSDYVKQLIAQPADLCMQCHDREYTKGNYTVANMKELLANNSDHHGPIRQKDCTACHNTHGSNYFRMLMADFPPVFYAGYNPENYQLCFMCHENTIPADPETSTLTNFRNGTQNLHFVHVNKKRKGRTCRACHDAHATNNPKHIRDSVPFGAWPLPVGFKKTETGGSCQPGCHQLFTYDRNNPARNR